jgi:type IV secretory pathway TraG/TraD family ATPase VirD4
MLRYVLYFFVFLFVGSALLEIFKHDILQNISRFFIVYRLFICGFLGFLLFYILSEGLKNKDKRSGLKLKFFIVAFFIVLISFAANIWFVEAYFGFRENVYENLFISCLIGFLTAIVFQQLFILVQQTMTSKTAIQSTLERSKKSDIRDFEKGMLKEKPKFDPKKHFKKDKFFLAEDEDGKPIYWTEETLPHIQVCGATGSGKGVALGSIAAQCLYKDEAVFIFDPKNDEWLPQVAYQAAQDTGKDYFIVDLNQATYQFNMFEDITPAQQFEMLCAGFGFIKTGNPGPDFYIPPKRKMAEFVSQNWHLGQTAEGFYAEYADFLKNESEDFEQSFRELAAIKAVNAKHGLSLKNVVENGGIVYIIGSMRNEAVKAAQKMLLVRLVQIAESRDRIKGNIRPICVVLDELKYHISRPAIEALGAARDKGLHVVMAHQSIADLKDCPQDLNADAVEGAVLENSTIKLIYRVEMPETAKTFAEKSGSILVDDEVRTVDRSLSLAESVSDERKLSQSETTLIDMNRFLTFPKRSGVLFGVGLAKIVNTSPYIATKSYTAIEVMDQGSDEIVVPDSVDFGKL